MKAAPSDMKLTYEDFLLFPDDGRRHELMLLPGLEIPLQRIFA